MGKLEIPGSDRLERKGAANRSAPEMDEPVPDGTGHECLYAILSARPALASDKRSEMRVLLPHPDTTPGMPRPPMPAVPASSGARGELSGREIEIMQWVKMGKTNQEIACILDLSVCTVKNHLYRIFRKIDAYNRTQAVSKLESLVRHV